MCGIVGIASSEKTNPQLKLIDQAIKSIHHRGPDSQDTLTFDQVALGHTRLSIIDPSPEGNQPFTDQSGRYALVYNGEVFNFQELKNQLLQDQIKFKTQTDTEVILYHLIKHGSEGLKDFNGFFALAFYDNKENSLIIARDRTGIKPLYYTQNNNSLIFSSEVRPILKFLPELKINSQVTSWYLQYTYSPIETTCVDGIKKLKPGTFLNWQNGKIEDQKAFASLSNLNAQNKGNKSLSSLLEDAVINRLVADVPLGAFLSGGIDSSIVTYIAKKHLADLNTYSVGFKNSNIDESHYAEEVAKHLGTYHHKIIIEEADFISHVDHILDAYDEPFGDSSSVAMYFLTKEASKDLRVALSGDGADELLGGYRKHQAAWKSMHQKHLFHILKPIHLFTKNQKESRLSKWGNFSRKVNRFMALKNLSPSEQYWFLARFNTEEMANQLLKEKSYTPPYSIDDEKIFKDFNQILLEDQKNILPNDMLKKVDLMSMRNGMEVRPVFLDDWVIEYCNQLPVNTKLDGKKGKLILREQYAQHLPSNVFSRKKQGFEIPLEEWLFNMRDSIKERVYFSRDYIVEQNIWEEKAISNILDRFYNGEKKLAHLIWCIWVYQHWYDKNIIN